MKSSFPTPPTKKNQKVSTEDNSSTNREGKHAETNLGYHALPGPLLSSQGKPHPVDVGHIKTYLHAALRAPSTMQNQPPWSYKNSTEQQQQRAPQ